MPNVLLWSDQPETTVGVPRKSPWHRKCLKFNISISDFVTKSTK